MLLNKYKSNKQFITIKVDSCNIDLSFKNIDAPKLCKTNYYFQM